MIWKYFGTGPSKEMTDLSIALYEEPNVWANAYKDKDRYSWSVVCIRDNLKVNAHGHADTIELAIDKAHKYFAFVKENS